MAGEYPPPNEPIKKPRDYYKVLGVSRTAKVSEIKSAYRKLARQHHPDKHGADLHPELNEAELKALQADHENQFKQLNEAYGVLVDPDRRVGYDRSGGSATTSSSSGSAHQSGWAASNPFDRRSASDMFADFMRDVLGEHENFYKQHRITRKHLADWIKTKHVGRGWGDLSKQILADELPIHVLEAYFATYTEDERSKPASKPEPANKADKPVAAPKSPEKSVSPDREADEAERRAAEQFYEAHEQEGITPALLAEVARTDLHQPVLANVIEWKLASASQLQAVYEAYLDKQKTDSEKQQGAPAKSAQPDKAQATTAHTERSGEVSGLVEKIGKAASAIEIHQLFAPNSGLYKNPNDRWVEQGLTEAEAAECASWDRTIVAIDNTLMQLHWKSKAAAESKDVKEQALLWQECKALYEAVFESYIRLAKGKQAGPHVAKALDLGVAALSSHFIETSGDPVVITFNSESLHELYRALEREALQKAKERQDKEKSEKAEAAGKIASVISAAVQKGVDEGRSEETTLGEIAQAPETLGARVTAILKAGRPTDIARALGVPDEVLDLDKTTDSVTFELEQAGKEPTTENIKDHVERQAVEHIAAWLDEAITSAKGYGEKSSEAAELAKVAVALAERCGALLLAYEQYPLKQAHTALRELLRRVQEVAQGKLEEYEPLQVVLEPEELEDVEVRNDSERQRLMRTGRRALKHLVATKQLVISTEQFREMASRYDAGFDIVQAEDALAFLEDEGLVSSPGFGDTWEINEEKVQALPDEAPESGATTPAMGGGAGNGGGPSNGKESSGDEPERERLEEEKQLEVIRGYLREIVSGNEKVAFTNIIIQRLDAAGYKMSEEEVVRLMTILEKDGAVEGLPHGRWKIINPEAGKEVADSPEKLDVGPYLVGARKHLKVRVRMGIGDISADKFLSGWFVNVKPDANEELALALLQSLADEGLLTAPGPTPGPSDFWEIKIDAVHKIPEDGSGGPKALSRNEGAQEKGREHTFRRRKLTLVQNGARLAARASSEIKLSDRPSQQAKDEVLTYFAGKPGLREMLAAFMRQNHYRSQGAEGFAVRIEQGDVTLAGVEALEKYISDYYVVDGVDAAEGVELGEGMSPELQQIARLFKVRAATAGGVDERFVGAVDVALANIPGTALAVAAALQRSLKVGYGRAASLLEVMGELGIVKYHKDWNSVPSSITPEQWDQLKPVLEALAQNPSLEVAGVEAGEKSDVQTYLPEVKRYLKDAAKLGADLGGDKIHVQMVVGILQRSNPGADRALALEVLRALENTGLVVAPASGDVWKVNIDEALKIPDADTQETGEIKDVRAYLPEIRRKLQRLVSLKVYTLALAELHRDLAFRNPDATEQLAVAVFRALEGEGLVSPLPSGKVWKIEFEAVGKIPPADLKEIDDHSPEQTETAKQYTFTVKPGLSWSKAGLRAPSEKLIKGMLALASETDHRNRDAVVEYFARHTGQKEMLLAFMSQQFGLGPGRERYKYLEQGTVELSSIEALAAHINEYYDVHEGGTAPETAESEKDFRFPWVKVGSAEANGDRHPEYSDDRMYVNAAEGQVVVCDGITGRSNRVADSSRPEEEWLTTGSYAASVTTAHVQKAFEDITRDRATITKLDAGQMVIAAIKAAHLEVKALADSTSEYKQAGCTVTAGMVWQEGQRRTMLIFHVGDSRAYLQTPDGRLDQQTTDVEPNSFLGTAAHYGGTEDIDIEFKEVELVTGSKVAFTTDGIHDNLDEAHISTLIAHYDAESAPRELIKDSKRAGKIPDDMSVVVFEIGELEDSQDSTSDSESEDPTPEPAPISETAPDPEGNLEVPEAVVRELAEALGLPEADIAKLSLSRNHVETLVGDLMEGEHLHAARPVKIKANESKHRPEINISGASFVTADAVKRKDKKGGERVELHSKNATQYYGYRDTGVFVAAVADPEGPQKAAVEVSRVFADAFRDRFGGKDKKGTDNVDGMLHDFGEVILQTSADLKRAGVHNWDLSTTFVLGVPTAAGGYELRTVHFGGTAAYVQEGGTFERLTPDQTEAASAVGTGPDQLTPLTAQVDPRRNKTSNSPRSVAREYDKFTKFNDVPEDRGDYLVELMKNAGARDAKVITQKSDIRLLTREAKNHFIQIPGHNEAATIFAGDYSAAETVAAARGRATANIKAPRGFAHRDRAFSNPDADLAAIRIEIGLASSGRPESREAASAPAAESRSQRQLDMVPTRRRYRVPAAEFVADTPVTLQAHESRGMEHQGAFLKFLQSAHPDQVGGMGSAMARENAKLEFKRLEIAATTAAKLVVEQFQAAGFLVGDGVAERGRRMLIHDAVVDECIASAGNPGAGQNLEQFVQTAQLYAHAVKQSNPDHNEALKKDRELAGKVGELAGYQAYYEERAAMSSLKRKEREAAEEKATDYAKQLSKARAAQARVAGVEDETNGQMDRARRALVSNELLDKVVARYAQNVVEPALQAGLKARKTAATAESDFAQVVNSYNTAERLHDEDWVSTDNIVVADSVSRSDRSFTEARGDLETAAVEGWNRALKKHEDDFMADAMGEYGYKDMATRLLKSTEKLPAARKRLLEVFRHTRDDAASRALASLGATRTKLEHISRVLGDLLGAEPSPAVASGADPLIRSSRTRITPIELTPRPRRPGPLEADDDDMFASRLTPGPVAKSIPQTSYKAETGRPPEFEGADFAFKIKHGLGDPLTAFSKIAPLFKNIEAQFPDKVISMETTYTDYNEVKFTCKAKGKAGVRYTLSGRLWADANHVSLYGKSSFTAGMVSGGELTEALQKEAERLMKIDDANEAGPDKLPVGGTPRSGSIIKSRLQDQMNASATSPIPIRRMPWEEEGEEANEPLIIDPR